MSGALRGKFLAFDDALGLHGVPPLTEWWREGIGRWLDAYENGNVLELWACCGRGAAKSTAIYKIALFFTLFGVFTIPPGEIHYAIVLSRLKEEAGKGISIVSRWLTLLSVPHRVAGDVIELVGLPRGIRVAAASVAGVSGWRAYFLGKDERSKWPFGGVDDLDAEEIDTSAAAMTATHRNAPMVTGGSAWGALGSFFDAITGGSNDSRIVLGPTPTWIAAPHIREEDCRRKESDPRRFLREYACVFQAGLTSAIDADQARAALRPFRYAHALGPVSMGVDFSQGCGDAVAWLCAQFVQRELADEEIFECEEIEPNIFCFKDVCGQRVRRNPAPPPPRPELRIFGVRARAATSGCSARKAWRVRADRSFSRGDDTKIVGHVKRTVNRLG